MIIILPSGILDDGVHSALRRNTAFALDSGCTHVMIQRWQVARRGSYAVSGTPGVGGLRERVVPRGETPDHLLIENPVHIKTHRHGVFLSGSLLQKPGKDDVPRTGGFVNSGTEFHGASDIGKGRRRADSLPVVKHQLRDMVRNQKIPRRFRRTHERMTETAIREKSSPPAEKLLILSGKRNSSISSPNVRRDKFRFGFLSGIVLASDEKICGTRNRNKLRN